MVFVDFRVEEGEEIKKIMNENFLGKINSFRDMLWLTKCIYPAI